jgi:hypothetical protein
MPAAVADMLASKSTETAGACPLLPSSGGTLLAVAGTAVAEAAAMTASVVAAGLALPVAILAFHASKLSGTSATATPGAGAGAIAALVDGAVGAAAAAPRARSAPSCDAWPPLAAADVI